ncbi:meiosis specific serine/threonine protein kinase (NDR family) Mug27/Slk1 [Schizosaccharomyces osmophilus]|uniref:non-specific serine/threonine protein kinase n=1 Tax=Schizosaccharomyces osmophilus TaxID=2545709 RepID=A0AAE9WEH2_9SCHI|nr:meiosis specific serine/threonine protein kinase (NDR family) Mug27/Slk1 [Schizosaccharomyces osmophilus]WBW74365.1 meiosis specific serine/threonine protein kinase (NDR family) Mug27/Slk1 [Schizosaccharomyces osmophilus]
MKRSKEAAHNYGIDDYKTGNLKGPMLNSYDKELKNPFSNQLREVGKNKSIRKKKREYQNEIQGNPFANSNLRDNDQENVLPSVSSLSHDKTNVTDEKGKPYSKRTVRLGTIRYQLLRPSQVEVLSRPEVARKRVACQLYFLNHYISFIDYHKLRKERLNQFAQCSQDLKASKQKRLWKEHCGRERAFLRKQRTKVQNNHFDLLVKLGQGGYGSVWLAKKKDTHEFVALKMMKKAVLQQMGEVRHILTERDVLTNTNSEWLTKLFYAFQDQSCVYLAMEYVPGGDFRTYLAMHGLLRERQIRFYLAEMFMAVNEVHKLGYTHRDLKPENFLIDKNGHLKLGDFGLSTGLVNSAQIRKLRKNLAIAEAPKNAYLTQRQRKNIYKAFLERNGYRANSIVGSPEYMAPEVIYGNGYDKTVDYWSLGCILYECAAGYPPFSGATTQETWTNLYFWKDVLQRPEKSRNDQYDKSAVCISDNAWSFILKCLGEPEMRFQSMSEVQKHPYFSKIHWNHLRSHGRPPFIPHLSDQLDTSHFDDFSNEAVMEAYKDVYDKQRMMEEKMRKCHGFVNQRPFQGFTYKHRTSQLKPAKQEEGNEWKKKRESKPKKKKTKDRVYRNELAALSNSSSEAVPLYHELKAEKKRQGGRQKLHPNDYLRRKEKDYYEVLF